MKKALFCLFVLVALPMASAVSGNEAVNLVANAGHYLYDSETYTPPNVSVEFGGNSYWVIPVTSGNNITTYFAVAVDSGGLSTSRSVNRGLFGVAEELRELQLLKESISANSGVEWVFTQKYETIFSEIAVQMDNEVFQLNTVETTLDSEGLNLNLSPLRNELSGLSANASGISSKLASASSLENEFSTKPSQENFGKMKGAFDSVFGSISGLNSDSVSKLRQNEGRL